MFDHLTTTEGDEDASSHHILNIQVVPTLEESPDIREDHMKAHEKFFKQISPSRESEEISQKFYGIYDEEQSIQAKLTRKETIDKAEEILKALMKQDSGCKRMAKEIEKPLR